MTTHFGIPLPIDAPSSIAKLGRVIPGFWRCFNGMHAEVHIVTAHCATGLSSRSNLMHWNTFTGRLVNSIETGWDLKEWVGHLPQGTASPTPTAPPSPDCTDAHSAGGRI